MSAIFAHSFYGDPLPDLSQLKTAFPTAVIWSIVIMLPTFFVRFAVSKILFPGRVGLLTMSEVVVAIFSAAVLVPEETLLPVQWLGAVAIVAAGIIEVVFGYSKSADYHHVPD